MYNLFSKRFESASSITKPPGFELIRRTYQRELANITDYYNSRVYAVQSNHLLCRVITSGFVNTDYSLDRFMDVAYSRSPYVAKHFNMTDEISYGKMFDGVFYGKGCDEVIMYNDDYFNAYDALENWKTLTPVKVLEHPISDFSLILPDGKVNNTAKGLAVITINIPMLLLMYKGFLIQQAAKIGQAQLGVEHFVHMYVLPGMMQSHMEIVFLNRLKNNFYAAPMSASTRHLPFLVVDYSDKVDRVCDEILDNLNDSSKPFFMYLKNIPCFYSEDMQDALIMPDVTRTRQIWWSLLLTRLGTIKFLLDLGNERGRVANMSMINKLLIDIRQIKRENIVSLVLPEDLLYETLVTFEDIQAT